MKILHFIYDHINNPWVGGGGAVRVYEIYKRLSEKDHKISVISGKYKGAKDYKVNENFEYRFVGTDRNYMLSTFSYAFASSSLLKKIYKDYDVVIEDFAPWNPIFSYKLKNVANIILQIQNYTGYQIIRKYAIFGIPFYFIEKLYPKFYKNIIVVSDTLNKKLRINGKVISNGIEIFTDNISIGKYISFLGRIDINQKGLDILIKSLENIKDKELIVAGDGKDKYVFIKMIRNMQNIRYIGKVSGKEKYTFIKNSLFLIMPSRFEGQGIVALEAAAMGKPVIVSDISELRYVVENGFGLSFKSGDYKDLREKIIYLFNNPELIRDMGQKGVEYAKNFLWDSIALQYEKYLYEVIGER